MENPRVTEERGVLWLPVLEMRDPGISRGGGSLLADRLHVAGDKECACASGSWSLYRDS